MLQHLSFKSNRVQGFYSMNWSVPVSRAGAKTLLLLLCCSGLIVPERYGNETVPEVVSQSGFALLHFFSDAAYNLTGFNISYRSELSVLTHPPSSSIISQQIEAQW